MGKSMIWPKLDDVTPRKPTIVIDAPKKSRIPAGGWHKTQASFVTMTATGHNKKGLFTIFYKNIFRIVTKIKMLNNIDKNISDVCVGDLLSDGSKITGTMVLMADGQNMYKIGNVTVTAEDKMDSAKLISATYNFSVTTPAATNPITGISLLSDSLKTIPREAPESIFIKPFFSIALRCCSAAFGDLKPNFLAISALVGGNPKSVICVFIKFKISSCLFVKFFILCDIRCR